MQESKNKGTEYKTMEDARNNRMTVAITSRNIIVTYETAIILHIT